MNGKGAVKRHVILFSVTGAPGLDEQNLFWFLGIPVRAWKLTYDIHGLAQEQIVNVVHPFWAALL